MHATGSADRESGPPSVRGVLNDVLGMLRQSFGRIAGVALIFFALPAVLATSAEAVIESVGETHSLLVFSAALVALFVAATLRILGPVGFAGFLDRAVAREYLDGDRLTLGQVMRTLPWRSLFIADVIVTVAVGIGLTFFVIPGLLLYGMFGLIGPIVVQERAPLGASFRRTLQLARLAPVVVALLVVIPFAFEEILHELMYDALHSAGLGVQITVEWIVAILVGGTLGLLEVALAAELMERNPVAPPAVALLNDGQAPAV